MNAQDYEWLTNNIKLLGPTQTTREEIKEIFAIYNRSTGDTKAVTSCSRCVSGVKDTLHKLWIQKNTK